MSHPSNSVSIHPYFKAHPGKLDAIKASLPDFIAKTATEKKNLYYDFTLNGDLLFCREAYVDAEAVLAHLTNVGPLLQELLKIADLTRLEAKLDETPRGHGWQFTARPRNWRNSKPRSRRSTPPGSPTRTV